MSETRTAPFRWFFRLIIGLMIFAMLCFAIAAGGALYIAARTSTADVAAGLGHAVRAFDKARTQ